MRNLLKNYFNYINQSLIITFNLLKSSRKVRNADQVKLEYEYGSWNKVKLNFFQTLGVVEVKLSDFLFRFAFPEKKFFAITNNFNVCDSYDYYKFKAQKIISLFNNSNESILELGCGFGWNLAVLRNAGHKGSLFGIDISATGISLAKEISNRYDLEISFYNYDLNEVDSFSFLRKEINTIFIYQVLEQLPQNTSNIIRQVVEQFPGKRFVIVESSSELFPKNLSDVLTKLYVYKQNYQNRLLKTLRELESKNLVRQLSISRYRCSHKLGHESMLLTFYS